MPSFGPDPIPRPDELLFLPLGGVGEIGMNLALYGHAGAWLMVDLGITFAGDQFPDYDVMMADPAFIERHRERLVGLVLVRQAKLGVSCRVQVPVGRGVGSDSS